MKLLYLSILYFCLFFFFLKKVASFESLVQSWLYGGKRSHEDGEKGLSLDYKLLYFNTFVKCYIVNYIERFQSEEDRLSKVSQ